MNKHPQWKNALYVVSTAGIIGFAAYGIYHTVDASQAIAENTVITNADTIKYDPSVSSGCGPYGCAGCNVCTILQYQQNSEVAPTYQIDRTY